MNTPEWILRLMLWLLAVLLLAALGLVAGELIRDHRPQSGANSTNTDEKLLLGLLLLALSSLGAFIIITISI